MYADSRLSEGTDLSITEEERTKIVFFVIIAIVIGCVILVLYGFVNTGSDCETSGGEYVKTYEGYKCIGEKGE